MSIVLNTNIEKDFSISYQYKFCLLNLYIYIFQGLTVYLDGCKQVSLDAELGTFPQKRNLALAWPST